MNTVSPKLQKHIYYTECQISTVVIFPWSKAMVDAVPFCADISKNTFEYQEPRGWAVLVFLISVTTNIKDFMDGSYFAFL